MQRYKSLNDEHTKAKEAEERRQREERARLEAERDQRAKEQRHEGERKGYEIFSAQKLLDEQRRDREKAERDEQAKRQMGVQAREMTRVQSGPASGEAQAPARMDTPKREPEPQRPVTTSRGHLEFTPLGPLFRHVAPRPSALDRNGAADAAPQRVEEQEKRAAREITAAPRAESRRDSPDKTEAATAQRVASGKEYSAAYQAFLARQDNREKSSRDIERGRERSRNDDNGRERSRGGDGRD